MAVMIIFEDSSSYTPVRLTGRPITLGRSSKAQLQLKDSMCSGQHATLHIEKDGNVILTDLNSTNGTYINESLVSTATRVFVDDIVRLGDTRLWIDKKSLSPKERQILGVSTNKTSFTKIDLPGMEQDQLSMAKAARRKAMGVPEVKPEAEEEEHQEISVIFDQNEFEDAIAPKELKADENADQEVSSPKLKSMKAKVRPSIEANIPDSEVQFDMEESSGKTKMIKLERVASKSNKKKIPSNRNKVQKKESKGLFNKVKGIFGKDN